MKQALVFSVLALTVTGCGVPQRDFFAVQTHASKLQRQVDGLRGELTRSRQELSQTHGQLVVAKKQRQVIRLPTGAPIEIRERSASQNNAVQSEEALFDTALKQYKSGDATGAVASFKSFNSRHPKSQKRSQALFYQGQAAYTIRDYSGAKLALEPLVYQPVNGQVNQPAVRLLKMVYLAQGNNTPDITRLSAYLQAISGGAPLTEAGATAKAAAAEALKPMRPHLTN